MTANVSICNLFLDFLTSPPYAATRIFYSLGTVNNRNNIYLNVQTSQVFAERVTYYTEWKLVNYHTIIFFTGL